MTIRLKQIARSQVTPWLKHAVKSLRDGSGGQGQVEETGCEIICGAQTTLAVTDR